jgi:hypothetical protein
LCSLERGCLYPCFKDRRSPFSVEVEGGDSPVDRSVSASKDGHVEYSIVKWDSTLTVSKIDSVHIT